VRENVGFEIMNNEQQRKANRRLGLVLVSVALAFALGFFARIALFGAG
jgi:predicted nucleic acid-binding Zn ribbon protein